MIRGLSTIRRRMTSGATMASSNPTRPAVDDATVSPEEQRRGGADHGDADHDGRGAERPPSRAGRVQDEQQRPAAQGDAEELPHGPDRGREDDDRQRGSAQDDAERVGPCELGSKALEPRLIGWAGGQHRGAW